MNIREQTGLTRLIHVIEECEDRDAKLIVTITPTTKEMELDVDNDRGFIPGVAIQTASSGPGSVYRTVDDLADDLLDDLAAAAIKAHTKEPTPKKPRRKR